MSFSRKRMHRILSVWEKWCSEEKTKSLSCKCPAWRRHRGGIKQENMSHVPTSRGQLLLSLVLLLFRSLWTCFPVWSHWSLDYLFHSFVSCDFSLGPLRPLLKLMTEKTEDLHVASCQPSLLKYTLYIFCVQPMSAFSQERSLFSYCGASPTVFLKALADPFLLHPQTYQ